MDKIGTELVKIRKHACKPCKGIDMVGERYLLGKDKEGNGYG